MLKKIKALINENRNFHKRNESYLKEIEWAHIFHDSIRGKKYLKKLSLNIGRWAGNYTFFYVLNRVLSDYKPVRILEFGLGESSKFISIYIENYLLESEHLIVEQDELWSKVFKERFRLTSRSKIVVCPIQKKEIKGYTVNSYANFSDSVNGKFDLYVVDGPFGSKNYSRYEIVDLAQQFTLDDEFIIILDDYNRQGEKEMIIDLLYVLNSKGIKTYKAEYSGRKTVLVIATKKYKYAQSL